MSLELPHKKDLTTNAKLPGQLTENFEAIEADDARDDKALADEVILRKKGDDDLSKRCFDLEESRVTYKKLKEVDSYWRDRLKRVALGTDEETIEIVLRKILVDEGIIKSDVNLPSDPKDLIDIGNVQPLSLFTDKAIYKPGDNLKLTIDPHDQSGSINIQITSYGNQVTNLQATSNGNPIEVNWKLPNDDYQGYVFKAILANELGGHSIGFIGANVNNHTEYVPIYGFLSGFTPNLSSNQMQEITKRLNRFHVNYVQFYDWYDRDDTPLRIVNGQPEQQWKDFMNRDVSFNKVKSYIDLVHDYGMQAMFYNLIYGSQLGIPSSNDNNLNWTNPNLTKEMFLYKNKDLTEYAGENHGGKLSITYMNPLNGAWGDYIAGQANVVYQNLPFDGWHVDQLGTLPSDTYSSDGVHLDWGSFGDGYGAVLKHTKAKNPDKRLTFNDVDDQGTDLVVKSNTVDFLYVEAWSNVGEAFNNLGSFIKKNQTTYHKPLVLAAYVNKEKAEKNAGDHMVNDASALLTDAVIMSNGASHLEWGEHYLANEYFPNSNLTIRDETINKIINYYDAFVAFWQILNGEWGTDEVTSSSHKLSNDYQKDTIAYVEKKSSKGRIISLINFIGTAHDSWRDNDGTQVPPQSQNNIKLHININEPINNVFLIHLDQSPEPIQAEYTKTNSGIDLTVDKLDIWDMIFIK